ncbi:MAG: hypothetical protein MUC29_01420 [Pyrinomonadaceae bacterium]|jgi:hypothetical protein|nr:hypothetical protein [Pyrinomonadaceae bacterium]
MKFIILLITILTFSVISNAQDQEEEKPKSKPNVIIVGAGKTAKVVGKGAVIVVGQAAKVTWKATKFTATEIAEPVGKAIIVKATPKVSSFMLKATGEIIKRGTPIATRLIITYLKL